MCWPSSSPHRKYGVAISARACCAGRSSPQKHEANAEMASFCRLTSPYMSVICTCMRRRADELVLEGHASQLLKVQGGLLQTVTLLRCRNEPDWLL